MGSSLQVEFFDPAKWVENKVHRIVVTYKNPGESTFKDKDKDKDNVFH